MDPNDGDPLPGSMPYALLPEPALHQPVPTSQYPAKVQSIHLLGKHLALCASQLLAHGKVAVVTDK